MFIQGIPVEIQTATYWGLMTALLPLLLPSSILPPASSHSVLILQGKIWHALQNYYFFFIFFLIM